ncbi:MAG: enoyl-CoA hydratase/isomerase family protein, partial [Eggerthella lenta]
ALNGVTSKAMENIMNNAETDPAVRAIIVTGTGKVFCAGEDLSELSEGGECQTVTEHGFGGLTARLCSKPVIAACNGSAAGGGMEIALSCDMVVASERAKFGCTEVGLGIIASTGGLVRLARDINRKDCMELLLTGKKIKADEAKALGLINYVVPAEEVMDKAIELAEECLKNAPLALKWTKYIVHAADQMSEEDAMRYSDAAYRFLEKTADGIEGPAAFVEKRAPTDRSLGELPHRRSAHEEPATEAGSSAARLTLLTSQTTRPKPSRIRAARSPYTRGSFSHAAEARISRKSPSLRRALPFSKFKIFCR